ncbi:hypothetical protein T4E_7306 [Trichinella pseudospiralis]|uniref:Uncharacterized protein n=1 Tax=Trichinella pseudospiralis TaxID=6337 RepID=A0A0V0Y2E4_TRIPS|nr:hypothetical protein T4E_7306 [Trichinella pseudospiralis]
MESSRRLCIELLDYKNARNLLVGTTETFCCRDSLPSRVAPTATFGDNMQAATSTNGQDVSSP